MTKLVLNQMEYLTGGDDIEDYCFFNSGGGPVDRQLCEAELRGGVPESQYNQSINIDPLIAGCFAGGVLAILLGFVNPVLGRMASAGVTVGCTIAKVAGQH